MSIPASLEATRAGAPLRRVDLLGRLWRRRWVVAFIAALAAGIVLRFVWPNDIEYKGDEAWTVAAVEAFWRTHLLRPVGIPSSAGLPQPGLSLWFFWGVSAFLPSIGPLELTRAVAVVNVLALLLLALFVVVAIDKKEREPWLWSVALVAANPLLVEYSRKLWVQDMQPLFTVAMLAAWWQRKRRWGSFCWGLAGALLGQVHLSGFVFAAAFLGWTFLFDRRSIRWPAWLGGSALGAIPLIPWLFFARQYSGEQQPLELLKNPLIPLGHWINFSLGTDLYKTLGDDFSRFVAFPVVGGRSTYLAAASIAAIVAVFVVLIARFLRRLHVGKTSAVTLFFRHRDATTLAVGAAFLGYCTLLLVMPRPAYLHYMIVAFNLPGLWLAWAAQQGDRTGVMTAGARRLLAGLLAAQMALTLLFLVFVHQQQVIRGDYGTAFGSQSHPK